MSGARWVYAVGKPANDPMLPDPGMPTITVALTTDTAPGGGVNSDGVTSAASLTGAVTNPGDVATLWAGLGGAGDSAMTEVTAHLMPDGSFTLDGATLDAVAAPALSDGEHILQIAARDSSDAVIGRVWRRFTLDRQAPQVEGTNPDDEAAVGKLFGPIRVTFSEPMDAASLTAGHIQLAPASAPGSPLTPVSVDVVDDGQAVELDFGPLTPGDYQLTLDATMLADVAGHVAGGQAIVSTFSVMPFDAVFDQRVSDSLTDPANGDRGEVPGPDEAVFLADSAELARDQTLAVRSLLSDSRLDLEDNATLGVRKKL